MNKWKLWIFIALILAIMVPFVSGCAYEAPPPRPAAPPPPRPGWVWIEGHWEGPPRHWVEGHWERVTPVPPPQPVPVPPPPP